MGAAPLGINITMLLRSFALSLLITEAVELALSFFLGIRKPKGLILVFLANLMTNPPLVYIYFLMSTFIGRATADIAVYPLEVLIVFAEALLYAKTPGMLKPEEEFLGRKASPALSGSRFRSALLMSVILNLASYATGLLI